MRFMLAEEGKEEQHMSGQELQKYPKGGTGWEGNPEAEAAEINTWKCLVWPGVADTDTFLLPMMVLIVELLPTFG